MAASRLEEARDLYWQIPAPTEFYGK